MHVIKRDGRKEAVKFDKITARIQKLCYGLSPLVDPTAVALRVIEGLYDGVTTSELDSLAAEVSASMTVRHPDYAQLAARIAVSNLHKNTNKSFTETMRAMHQYVNPKTNQASPLIADDVMELVEKNSELLDSTVIYDRDFNYDYFGFKTLERSYLLRNSQREHSGRHRNVRRHVARTLHARHSDALQFGHAEAPDVELFLAANGRRQY